MPTSSCQNPRHSDPKDNVPYIIDLIVVLGGIVLLWFSTHTVFTGLSSGVPGYEYSLKMMSPYSCTRHGSLPVCHWFTAEFLVPVFMLPGGWGYFV